MFQDIHPNGSGDGRLHLRRTTYKPGDTRQEMRRCFQCGFPFREGKDVQGDSIDSGGNYQVVSVNVTMTAVKAPQPLKNMTSFFTSPVNYSDQQPSGGCRLCQTFNPKGLRRERDWERATDLSNK